MKSDDMYSSIREIKKKLETEFSGKTVCYIYTLEDPRTHEVRYVGKANNIFERYKAHCNKARDKGTHKRNWLELLRSNNLKPIMKIIDVIPKDNWQFWEKYWVQQYLSWGADLVNNTFGGDGLTTGNKTSFKIGDKPWNYGIGKSFICLMCGKEVKKKPRPTSKFCSPNCANIYASKHPNSGTFKKNRIATNMKSIIQMDLNGNTLKKFKNAKDAGICVGCTQGNIRLACCGINKTAKGYKWKYQKEINMKKENMIITIIGPSCVGKDTIARHLEKECGYNFVVSTTTRPIRKGESEKNPYYFITKDEFLNKIKNDEMIEYREYHTLVDNLPDTWYYGVEKKEIENKKYVAVLDIIGLKAFKQVFGDRVISFFLNTDDDIRKQRCIDRGDFDQSEWERRLADDKRVFAPEVIKEHVDYTISDTDKSTIVYKINNIISKTL